MTLGRKLEIFNKIWRPLTGTGVGVSIVAFPVVIVIMVWRDVITSSDLGIWIGLYGSMCTFFAALAGIRQFDKANDKNLHIARMEYNNTVGNTSYSVPHHSNRPPPYNGPDRYRTDSMADRQRGIFRDEEIPPYTQEDYLHEEY